MNSNSQYAKSVVWVLAVLGATASWSAWAQNPDMQTTPPAPMEEMKPVEDKPARDKQDQPKATDKPAEKPTEAKPKADDKPPVPAFGVNVDPFLVPNEIDRDDWKTYCEGLTPPDISDCVGKEIKTRDVLNDEHTLTQRIEYVEGDNGEEISHGITTLYWPAGTKKTQMSYVCGVRHGAVLSWHGETGQLWQKAGFCNNRDHGELVTWSADGLMQRRFTVEGGMWNGLFTDWFEDGTKRFEVQWVRGKRQGPAIWWDMNGRQHFQLDYIDNVRQP